VTARAGFSAEEVELDVSAILQGEPAPSPVVLNDRQYTVRVRYPEEARASVDAPRMLRVLHNLLANSLDAMRGGGLLDIRCGRVNGSCQLSVRDSGCGMPENVRRRVFEPFFTHGKAQGTGLGMAIVQRIVEEHGGSVRVDSAPGEGTTVTLALPAAEAPTAEAPAAPV